MINAKSCPVVLYSYAYVYVNVRLHKLPLMFMSLVKTGLNKMQPEIIFLNAGVYYV